MEMPHDDFYREEEVVERADSDSISPAEEGVMLGYLADAEGMMEEDWTIAL